MVSYQCILNEALEQDIKAPGDLQMFCKLGLLEKKCLLNNLQVTSLLPLSFERYVQSHKSLCCLHNAHTKKEYLLSSPDLHLYALESP